MRNYLKVTIAAMTAMTFVAVGCENQQKPAAPAAPAAAQKAAAPAAPAAPVAAVQKAAPAAPAVINYDELSTKIASKINTDAIADKVVAKIKAEKLFARADRKRVMPPKDRPKIDGKKPAFKKGPVKNLEKKKGKKGKKDKKKRPPKPIDKTVWKVEIKGHEAMKGAKDALVTIAVFSDFQCPFCGRVEPAIDQVLENYGDKVRVAWKDNPLSFHKLARGASLAACAANQQGKFWEMHKTLFANQRAIEVADLEKYAAEIGLDMTKYAADVASAECAKGIDLDMKMASDVGARGTPNLYINGRQVRGAVPYENIEPVIKEEIAKAEALLAKGITKENLYAEIIKNGKIFTPLDTTVQTFTEPAPFQGPENAPIVVTVYSDFQCPFCSRITPVIHDLVKAFPDNMKIEFRHFPLSFHKDAHLAAQASMAADAQGKFWEMHDKLFENQKQLKRENLDKYAQELGLDVAVFKKALDEGTYKGIVDRHFKEGQRSAVRGTPSLYINGRKFQAPSRDVATFKKIIDAEILNK
jgi:protein-disulfide isomerase